MSVKKDQRQFSIWFAIGLFLNWNWLAPWHEFGHVIGGTLMGQKARIVSLFSTDVWGDTNVFITLAGPMWEVLTWPLFIIACWKLKAPWGWHGLFWAQLFSAWAFTPFTTDLTKVYDMSGVDPLWWWFYTAPAVVILIIILKKLQRRMEYSTVAKKGKTSKRTHVYSGESGQ